MNKYISFYEYESEILLKTISKALFFEKVNIVKVIYWDETRLLY